DYLDNGRPSPHVLLTPESDVQRIQRRQYFRLKVALPVRYSVAPFADKLPSGVTTPLELKAYIQRVPREIARLNLAGNTIDLSGGGMLLQTSTALQANDALLLSIETPDLKLRQAGRVTRANEVTVEGERAVRAGIAFEGVQDRERDELMRFLFNEEGRR